MSLSSAMLTGFTGIQSNSVMVDTVGDNLANVNTTAFKGQRTLFETLIYKTINGGAPPSDTSGGTLPYQIGTGSTVSAIQRDFGQGALDSTTFPSDLAIDGDGFFILNTAGGDQVYTRDGSFRLNAEQTLVAAGGAEVQVFPPDGAGGTDTGTLSNLVIPLGTTGPAVPTTQVVMDGQLDADTLIASQAAVVRSEPMVTAGGGPATASTALTDLVNGDGVPLFATGDVLLLRASKGGLSTEEAPFVVGTDGSTLGDFASFIEDVVGIQTEAGLDDGSGVRIADGTDAPAGSIVVSSHPGEINAIELTLASVTNTTGLITSPFSFATQSQAVGGGQVTTSFNVFDSLGNPVDVRLRLALESKSEDGTTWRFYAESVGDSDLTPALGTGTLTFDTVGRLVSAEGADLMIDRAGSGASSPHAFSIDFDQVVGRGAEGDGSKLIMDSQDGAPPGVLIGYTIDEDGIVTGTYSNQQQEVFGQIALATFTNNEGLPAISENTYRVGVNSGDPQLVAPRTSVAGAIRSGWLEQSNVEIAREFVNLISATTGISSASRVVRVADDLLQQLLLIVN